MCNYTITFIAINLYARIYLIFYFKFNGFTLNISPLVKFTVGYNKSNLH